MVRTLAAIAASAIAIAVLIALIYSSRPLGTQAYSDHHARLNQIQSATAGVNGILEQLRANRRSGTSAASGVRPLRTGVEQDRQALAASMAGAGEADSTWRAFDKALEDVLVKTDQADEYLGSYAAALRILREEGPAAVQNLRGSGNGPDAQRFYTLLLKTLEYSQVGSTADAAPIQSQVDALRNSDRALPTFLLDVASATDSVLAGRNSLDQVLGELQAANFDDRSRALSTQLATTHNQAVRQRENARLLVSLYSLLLFAGLGFLGLRLHGSYRELNQVNEQLKLVNVDLEKRVEERTRDVQKAYTDLQQSQVQLVQAEKMSSLGQLVAGISHEINTPLLYLQSNATLNKETLARIMSFIDACHDKLLPKLQPGEDKAVARGRFLTGLKELQHALVDEEIREELQEVMSLTDDNLEGLEELTLLAQGLKDFSRLDRAPVDSFNVNEGVDRTLMIARNMLKTRIQVTTNLGDVPEISCAPSQINQVMLNLITNAAQAIEREGTIDITTAQRGEFVTVEIKDNGSGIPNEIMDKIRDPFFTTKEVGSGTGLGLSIVEEILSKHGGRLEIESKVGVGSIFTLFLPAASNIEHLDTAFAPVDEAPLVDEPPIRAVAEPTPFDLEIVESKERGSMPAEYGKLAAVPD